MFRDPPPDEEFLDHSQQDLMRTKDMPESQEEGSTFSQRCPRSWKSSPVEESGRHHNQSRTGCQAQCQKVALEIPTTAAFDFSQ